MGLLDWFNKKQKNDAGITSEEVGESLERIRIMNDCNNAINQGFESKLYTLKDFESVIEEVFELFFEEGYLPRPPSYTVFHQIIISPLIKNEQYIKQYTYYYLEKNRRDLAVSFEYDHLKRLNIPEFVRNTPVLRMGG